MRLLLFLLLFMGTSLRAQDYVEGPYSLVEVTGEKTAFKAWAKMLEVKPSELPRSVYKTEMKRLGEWVGIQYDGKPSTNQAIIHARFFYVRNGKLYYEAPKQDPNFPSRNKCPEEMIDSFRRSKRT